MRTDTPQDIPLQPEQVHETLISLVQIEEPDYWVMKVFADQAKAQGALDTRDEYSRTAMHYATHPLPPARSMWDSNLYKVKLLKDAGASLDLPLPEENGLPSATPLARAISQVTQWEKHAKIKNSLKKKVAESCLPYTLKLITWLVSLGAKVPQPPRSWRACGRRRFSDAIEEAIAQGQRNHEVSSFVSTREPHVQQQFPLPGSISPNEPGPSLPRLAHRPQPRSSPSSPRDLQY